MKYRSPAARWQLKKLLEAWRESAGEESARTGQLSQQAKVRHEEFTRLGTLLEQLQVRVHESEERTEQNAAQLQAARNEYRATRERSEAHNEEVLRALHEKTAAANSARLLESSRGPMLARRERALARLGENDAQVQALREATGKSAARVEATRLSLADVPKP